MDRVHCIPGNFLVVPTFVARSAKTPEIVAAKSKTVFKKFDRYLCRYDRFLATYINVYCHKSTTSD